MQRNIDTYDIVLCNLFGIINSKYTQIISSLGEAPKKRLLFKSLFEKINKVRRIKKSSFKYRLKKLKSLGIIGEIRENIELLNKGEYLYQFIKDLEGNISPLKKDPLSLKILELMDSEKEITLNDITIFPKNLVNQKLKKFQKYKWIDIILSLPGLRVYKFTDNGKNLKEKVFKLKEIIMKNLQIKKTQIVVIDWEVAFGLTNRRLNELFIIGTAIKSLHGQESNAMLIREFNLSKSSFIIMRKELLDLKWIEEDEDASKIIPTEKGKLYLNKFIVNKIN
ncbi:MAG: hypothetical protein ACTSRP_07160 [Candidatus Helarchaeota archaeon]